MSPSISKGTAFSPITCALLAVAALSLLPWTALAATEHSTFVDRPASATSDRLGLGLMLGAPTGLSGKFRFNSRDALDFGLAFSFNNYIEVYSDYLYHFGSTLDGRHSSLDFTPYIGVGAVIFGNTAGTDSFDNRYFASSGTDVGVRVPFGVEWLSRRIPLGVFAEVAPGVGVIPATFGFLEGDVGARFYF